MYAYPKQVVFGKVLPKSKIYQYGRASRKLQQRFVDQVSRIVWQYKLSPETTNLAARPGVPEIQVFLISLKAEELDENVLRCIDKVIIFVGHAEMAYNVPLKFQLYQWDAEKNKPAMKLNPDFV